MGENWLKEELDYAEREVSHWRPRRSPSCLNAYNDGLEAAAMLMDDLTEFNHAESIRALKEPDDA